VPLLRPSIRRRRLFLIYFVTTVGGGLVLIFFVLTLWLLYWMQAPFRLPEAAILIPADAVAYGVLEVRADGKLNIPQGARLAGRLADAAPTPLTRLLEKGLREPRCPIRLVGCLVRRGESAEAVCTASLGRFPGLFGVVRRDLMRRSALGELQALTRSDGGALFLLRGDSDCPFLGMVDCSVIRGSSEAVVRDTARALAGKDRRVGRWPDPGALRRVGPATCVAWGWAEDWEALALDRWLPGPGGDSLPPPVAALLPQLESMRDLRIWARSLKDGILEVAASMATPDDATGEAVADALDGRSAPLGSGGPGLSFRADYDPAGGRLHVTIRTR